MKTLILCIASATAAFALVLGLGAMLGMPFGSTLYSAACSAVAAVAAVIACEPWKKR